MGGRLGEACLAATAAFIDDESKDRRMGVVAGRHVNEQPDRDIVAFADQPAGEP